LGLSIWDEANLRARARGVCARCHKALPQQQTAQQCEIAHNGGPLGGLALSTINLVSIATSGAVRAIERADGRNRGVRRDLT
jgi:hypothetical protein